MPGLPHHLGRKRHVGTCSGHAQFGKQADQLWVGALIEDQKTSVDAMGDPLAGLVQGQVHRVGVATIVVAGFKQGDVSLAAQPVRHRQAGDARTDDCQPHGAVPSVRGPCRPTAQGPAGPGGNTGKELGIKRLGNFVTDW